MKPKHVALKLKLAALKPKLAVLNLKLAALKPKHVVLNLKRDVFIEEHGAFSDKRAVFRPFPMSPRQLFNGFLTVALLAALVLIGRVLIAPDAGSSLFSRARQLEEAGQIALALRHYALVSNRHPESSLAPRALLKQGDLLSVRGRSNKNTEDLRNAMDAYARLAQNYPDNKLSNQALFDAGEIAAQNLSDGVSARKFYRLIMERNSDRSDEAAMATTKLGRLALTEGDGKTALALLQSVRAGWPNDAEAGAEAQFHLGVLYETVIKDRNKAQRAYYSTLQNYPKSVWAGDASERLGLLAYNDQLGRRPVRRVLLDIAPLPDTDGLANPSKGSDLWQALDILLGARGLRVDANVIGGWSLSPFFVGIDTTNPGRVVTPSFDQFANVVAQAGLRFTEKDGATAESALRDLQNDIDAAREPLLYIENGGEGRWMLCVGYDSERGEVYLQDQGAQFNTLAVGSFAQMWKAKSKFGKPFTMLSFVGQGEKPRSLAQLSAQQTPAPGATPLPATRLNTTPQFVWELPRLNQKNANTRALREAAQMLNRAGNDTVALNINGLGYLARELVRLADSPDPEAFRGFEEAPIRQEEAPLDANALDANSLDANAAPVPTPAATATPALRNFAPRARNVMAFFGEPARNWARQCRRAAAFCAVAGRQNNRDLSGAIANFNLSADSLDVAASLAPQIGGSLSPEDRAAMREMARQISVARDAEAAAARAMG